MRRAIFLAFGVTLGPALVVAAACGDAESYVFSARRYDPARSCLDPYTEIDLVNGASVSSKCGPTCFRFKNGIYTTRVCPPLPDNVDMLDAQAPECVAANDPALYDASCSDADLEGAGEDAAAVLDASTDGD